MNKIQEYLWFIQPDRRFLQLSYNLRELKPKLNELNERRKKLQIDYSVLRHVSHKCQDCSGLCCKAKYAPYFSCVDYLIRMFSDNPIRDDYFNWWRPRPIAFALHKEIRSRRGAPDHIAITHSLMCPNLTSNGCVLAAEDRPIRCVLWICDDLRKSIPLNVLKKMGLITRELSSISSEVIKCFQKIRT